MISFLEKNYIYNMPKKSKDKQKSDMQSVINKAEEKKQLHYWALDNTILYWLNILPKTFTELIVTRIGPRLDGGWCWYHHLNKQFNSDGAKNFKELSPEIIKYFIKDWITESNYEPTDPSLKKIFNKKYPDIKKKLIENESIYMTDYYN